VQEVAHSLIQLNNIIQRQLVNNNSTTMLTSCATLAHVRPSVAHLSTKPDARPGHCNTIRCSASSAQSASQTTYDAPTVPEITGSPNVVVTGGTGRVGASTAAALLAAVPGAKLSLASRTNSSYEAAVSRRPDLQRAAHVVADVTDPSSVLAAIKGADLVIHTAGPFQRRGTCDVLEACIAAGVPYLDVCDDTAYSKRAKQLHAKAQAAGVPAITTGGIYPGYLSHEESTTKILATPMPQRRARQSHSACCTATTRPGAGVLDPPSSTPRSCWRARTL